MALLMFDNNEDSNLSMPSTPGASVTGLETGVETGCDTDSQLDGSGSESTRKSKTRKRKTFASEVTDDSKLQKFPAENLFEYQWPPEKSGEYYLLQEQVSEFLAIKSFKRKYPDLMRRPVEIKEREFLKEKLVVTEHQCDLGLTAVRSDEIHDLMAKEYPAKYHEYASVLHEHEKQKIANKHKDYGEQQTMGKNKYEYYRKKAIKSAAEFNLNFMRERREERKAYFDLQTQIVHYPVNKYPPLPKEATKPSPYPVALIPGQYQDYYKMYTPNEMKYFPLRTAMYVPQKAGSSSLAAPDESTVSESDKAHSSSGGDSSSDSEDEDKSTAARDASVADANPGVTTSAKCHLCSLVKLMPNGSPEDMVQCAECKKNSHPSCIDLTAEMAPVIRTYPWQCMECKTCVECMDPGDEEKMMFCDHCDRGYHTFCVGLRNLPTGRWECPSCIPDQPASKQRKRKPKER